MSSHNDTWTVAELIAAYEASRESKLLAPATQRNTQKVFRWLAPFKARQLDDLTKAEMAGVADGLTDGNTHIFISRARALFSFARNRGKMNTDPLEGMKSPVPGEYRPWTRREVDVFLRGATPQTRMAIELAYYTGQRMSDVLAMRWDDIDKAEIAVQQQKTGALLTVPIHPKLRLAMRRHAKISHGDTIVAMENGQPYSIETFRHKFHRERDGLGLPDDLVFHGLRKLTAVSLAEGGASTREIMAVGGWRTTRMVDHYCKGSNQRKLAKSAIDKLGGIR
jgi:integrase